MIELRTLGEIDPFKRSKIGNNHESIPNCRVFRRGKCPSPDLPELDPACARCQTAKNDHKRIENILLYSSRIIHRREPDLCSIKSIIKTSEDIIFFTTRAGKITFDRHKLYPNIKTPNK